VGLGRSRIVKKWGSGGGTGAGAVENGFDLRAISLAIRAAYG
jgi:hypothetical protein